MESMLNQGHRFLGGIKHFWMAVRLEDEPRSGRPCTSKMDENVTKVRDPVRSDRRLTVRMISSVFNLNRQTVHEILTFELGMQKICAKLVPKILTNEQKEKQRNVCIELLERIEKDKSFFKHVITGDETWIFLYDPDTKRQSSEWQTSNSPHPKKARMSKSKIKTMLICFLDSQDVVRKKFVPRGQTVNKQYYREILERLRKRIHRVRPEIADTWLLHHDNAPCHTAISVNEVLAKKVFQWFRSHHARLI